MCQGLEHDEQSLVETGIVAQLWHIFFINKDQVPFHCLTANKLLNHHGRHASLRQVGSPPIHPPTHPPPPPRLGRHCRRRHRLRRRSPRRRPVLVVLLLPPPHQEERCLRPARALGRSAGTIPPPPAAARHARGWICVSGPYAATATNISAELSLSTNNANNIRTNNTTRDWQDCTIIRLH
ncbi:hypothetical protein B0I35DRAFT_506348 [Stachybotrys elegans]|uniref:Uncharacterized protein n=1 Tax=Stachybotrys elegans TaxID=80388 RepID=A0A8K0T0F5_9HYPO|nr:hypothetical protein B0I35DRAFT_506348 [Stachybotrys elegans]